MIGDYGLVIAGERATDGDTGQVGPGIAAWLNLPLATYVSKVDAINQSSITVERLVEEGYQILKLPLPALITVVKEVGVPRLPTLRGKKKARATNVPVYSTENMNLDQSYIGLKGSPTRVVKIDYPKVSRAGKIIKVDGDDGLDSAVEELLEFLIRRQLL